MGKAALPTTGLLHSQGIAVCKRRYIRASAWPAVLMHTSAFLTQLPPFGSLCLGLLAEVSLWWRQGKTWETFSSTLTQYFSTTGISHSLPLLPWIHKAVGSFCLGSFGSEMISSVLIHLTSTGDRWCSLGGNGMGGVVTFGLASCYGHCNKRLKVWLLLSFWFVVLSGLFFPTKWLTTIQIILEFWGNFSQQTIGDHALHVEK